MRPLRPHAPSRSTRFAVLTSLLVVPLCAQVPESDAIDELARRVAAAFDPAGPYPRTLPFAAMRVAPGDAIEVQLVGDVTWYEWRAIDGVAAPRIVAVCRGAFGDDWWKRLSEDLPEVVALMGTSLGPTVRLELGSLELGRLELGRLELGRPEGGVLVRSDVAMTSDNRRAVKHAGLRRRPAVTPAESAVESRAVESPAVESRAVTSVVATTPDPDLARLAARVRDEFDPRADPKTAAFVWMRPHASGGVVVQLADAPTRYLWRGLDDVPTARLVAVCRAAFGDHWWKRLCEDLPQVLASMGVQVGDAVDLELEELATQRVFVRRRVAMTSDNRRAVMRSPETVWNGDAPKAAPSAGTDPGGIATDARAGVAADLVAGSEADVATLRTLLQEQSAYALRGDDTLAQVLRALPSVRPDATPLAPGRLVLAVAECLATLGDGHAGVIDLPARVGGPWLPFLVEDVDGRLVALRADRSDFVRASHPYLLELDGEPIATWLATAERLVPRGAPASMRRQAVRTLREVTALRLLLGRPAGADVAVTLADDAGARHRARLALTDNRPVYGVWPRPEASLHHRLDGDVGYLRLPQMRSDSAFLDGIDAAMQDLRATRGLIVDVRGNGGGSRDALRRFLPYLLDEAQPARVVNVAAYRRGAVATERDDALADRGLFPASWSGWSTAAQAAIARTRAAFHPAWQPPAAAFSAWHYAVVERTDNARAYRYRAPVVVLIDHDCFSATDVFAGALRGLPGVTLVGTTTRGGSGRARRHRLPSGLEIRLSTMASFQPDGTPYDGCGVAPDVLVEPAAGDLLGPGDRMLAAALARLQ